MAKKKKPKGKVIGIQSAENFIKTRARSLPITECYINETWEQVKMASIVIVRSHVTQNRTFGFYLIDLNCLGIKDVAYYFNKPESEFESLFEMLSPGDMKKCDYELVHNIIYGAEEYADAYGFKPHKDWKIAQYILEKDDDNVPIIEIEFGHDGQPLYVQGPNETPAQSQKIIDTLEKNAGKGNFHFIVADDNDEDEDWNDDFDLDSEKAEETESFFAPGDLEKIMSGEQEPTFVQAFSFAFASYRLTYHDEQFISSKELNEGIQLTDVESELLRYFTDLETAESVLTEIGRAVESPENERPVLIEAIFKKHGNNPYAYLTKYQLTENSDEEAAAEIRHFMSNEYPDFLQFRFSQAFFLALQDKAEEAQKLTGQGLRLSESFPDRKGWFSIQEWIDYHLAMSTIFMVKGRLGMALSYGAEILEFYDTHRLVKMHLNALMNEMTNMIEDEE